MSFNRQDKLRPVWEPTYTVVHRELKEEADAAISASSVKTQVRRLMDNQLFLPDFDPNFSLTSHTSVGSYSVGDALPLLSRPPAPGEVPDDLLVPARQHHHHHLLHHHPHLQLLHILRHHLLYLHIDPRKEGHTQPTIYGNIEEFKRKKATNKLTQQLSDPLVVSAAALLAWCERLLTVFPMTVPFEIRQMYFHAIGVGILR